MINNYIHLLELFRILLDYSFGPSARLQGSQLLDLEDVLVEALGPMVADEVPPDLPVGDESIALNAGVVDPYLFSMGVGQVMSTLLSLVVRLVAYITYSSIFLWHYLIYFLFNVVNIFGFNFLNGGAFLVAI